MEQGGHIEGKQIESIGTSTRGPASGRERGSSFIGFALLRLFRNLSWSRGLRIPRRLTPSADSQQRPTTSLCYSDHIKSVSCCAAFCRFLQVPSSYLALRLLLSCLKWIIGLVIITCFLWFSDFKKNVCTDSIYFYRNFTCNTLFSWSPLLRFYNYLVHV